MDIAFLYFLCLFAIYGNTCSTMINEEVANLINQYDHELRNLYQNLNQLHWDGAMRFDHKTVKQLHYVRNKIRELNEQWHDKLSIYKHSRAYLRSRSIKLIDSIPPPINRESENYNSTKFYNIWRGNAFMSFYKIKPLTLSLNGVCDSSNNESNPIPQIYSTNSEVEERQNITILNKNKHTYECLYKNYMGIMRNKKTISNFPKLKEDYQTMINYYNKCCADKDEYFRNDDSKRILDELFDFYADLHALIKHNLAKHFYINEQEQSANTVPIHLTGNIWGLTWSNILQIIQINPILNYEGLIDQKIKDNNITTYALAKQAEQFWVSLGFANLSESFWLNSQIKNLNECSNISIKDSVSYNMYKTKEFRLVLCADPSYQTLLEIFHQLGHIYYYQEYNSLPILNQKPPVPEFEEVIGELLALSAINPNNSFLQNFTTLGLIDRASIVSYLMHVALRDMPTIMHMLAVKSWRQKVLSGQIQKQNYNTAWWSIVEKIQGLHHPDKYRNVDYDSDQQNYFDIGMSYHVTRNNGVDKFWRSILLKYQLNKGLWNYTMQKMKNKNTTFQATTKQHTLYNFDMYGNSDIGNKLRNVMKRGNGMDWRSAIHNLCNQTYFDVGPMLEFYRPLVIWLKSEIRRLHIAITWRPTL